MTGYVQRYADSPFLFRYLYLTCGFRYSPLQIMSTKGVTKAHLYVPASIFCIIVEVQHLIRQIRIDAEGTQEYIQFEAQPHPNVRPMAYQTGGLANLMM